jgi:hypothetical protein
MAALIDGEARTPEVERQDGLATRGDKRRKGGGAGSVPKFLQILNDDGPSYRSSFERMMFFSLMGVPSTNCAPANCSQHQTVLNTILNEIRPFRTMGLIEIENGEGPLVRNLESMIQFANDGIVSKTFLDRPATKLVLFCMAQGQTLSEHTSSMPASIHVIKGEGTVILGAERHNAVRHIDIHA